MPPVCGRFGRFGPWRWHQSCREPVIDSVIEAVAEDFWGQLAWDLVLPLGSRLIPPGGPAGVLRLVGLRHPFAAHLGGWDPPTSAPESWPMPEGEGMVVPKVNTDLEAVERLATEMNRTSLRP